MGDNEGFNEWHDGNCKTPGKTSPLMPSGGLVHFDIISLTFSLSPLGVSRLSSPGNETTVTAWEECGPEGDAIKASVQFWWMQGKLKSLRGLRWVWGGGEGPATCEGRRLEPFCLCQSALISARSQFPPGVLSAGARHTPSLAPHWANDMITWLLSQRYIEPSTYRP